jgi:hypothetical protein
VLLARDPAAYAPVDNPLATARLVEALHGADAADQVLALAARAAAHAPVDNPHATNTLLHALRQAGATDQAAVLLARRTSAADQALALTAQATGPNPSATRTPRRWWQWGARRARQHGGSR